MTRRLPTSWPRVTVRGVATSLSLTTSTYFSVCWLPIATSGTSSASCGADAGTRTRANMPGVNRSVGLGKTARPRMVPVPLSITLFTKSMWPL